MIVWDNYSDKQQLEYIKYLQVYGALTNLFRQKKGNLIPYLDSKFQETIFARVFQSENVDIGNTPHDVLSIVGGKRIGIGLKTWMGSKPSFQKVMQIKSYQEEINSCRNKPDELINTISQIKNTRLKSDYVRLGLSENDNIYHYVTRDSGRFTINECAYPLVNIDQLRTVVNSNSSITWSDGLKDYKFTYGDSQIWQRFDADKYGTTLIRQFDVSIIDDPFTFLMKSFDDFLNIAKQGDEQIEEVYLPLYSYRSKEVEDKSGLNAWRAASKTKGSNIPRPLNEIYITIPSDFHKKFPSFFTEDINVYMKSSLESTKRSKKDLPEVRFKMKLPNGKSIPAHLNQDGMKSLQSGSNTEKDEQGLRYGQSALGQWLLVDVLGLKERTKVTREWLRKKGTDSVRLWKNKGDYESINIDFAPFGAFESFMKDEAISADD